MSDIPPSSVGVFVVIAIPLHYRWYITHIDLVVMVYILQNQCVPSWLIGYNFFFKDLFPFGRRSGDQVVPRSIDRSEGPIKLSIPFVFYQRMEREIFVSSV